MTTTLPTDELARDALQAAEALDRAHGSGEVKSALTRAQLVSRKLWPSVCVEVAVDTAGMLATFGLPILLLADGVEAHELGLIACAIAGTAALRWLTWKYYRRSVAYLPLQRAIERQRKAAGMQEQRP